MCRQYGTPDTLYPLPVCDTSRHPSPIQLMAVPNQFLILLLANFRASAGLLDAVAARMLFLLEMDHG